MGRSSDLIISEVSCSCVFASDSVGLFNAIRCKFSSYVSFDFEDDNVILVASFHLAGFVIRAIAHALLKQRSTVLAVRLAILLLVQVVLIIFIAVLLLHLEAVVAEALCSAFHYVDSRSLAVPVPLVDLSRSHVKETGHLSDLK